MHTLSTEIVYSKTVHRFNKVQDSFNFSSKNFMELEISKYKTEEHITSTQNIFKIV